VERRALVRAIARELDEVADMVRGGVGQQLDDKRPGRRLDDSLLVAQLGGRKRR